MNTDIHTYIYIYIQWNTTHIHKGSHFGSDTVCFFLYFTCTPSILVWKLWADHLTSFEFFSAAHLLWLMKCPLVALQLTHFSSAPISFCPTECDVTFISSTESNAGLLHDRQEVYGLDHNPTTYIPHLYITCQDEVRDFQLLHRFTPAPSLSYVSTNKHIFLFL